MSEPTPDTATLHAHLLTLTEVQLQAEAAANPRLHYYSIARHFTTTPGSRLRADHRDPGYSGEELRADLAALLRTCLPGADGSKPTHDLVVVNLDGTYGLPASFLDEAFTGLLWAEHFDYAFLLQHLVLVEREGRSVGDEGMGYRQEILDNWAEVQSAQFEAVVVFQGPFGSGHAQAHYTLTRGGSDMELASDEDLAAQGIMRVFEGTRADAVAWRAAHPIISE